jgi:hypothetical protein
VRRLGKGGVPCPRGWLEERGDGSGKDNSEEVLVTSWRGKGKVTVIDTTVERGQGQWQRGDPCTSVKRAVLKVSRRWLRDCWVP